MRLRLVVVAGLVLALAGAANADSVYGFALGVSEQNTVVPGSVVSINATLLNTGSTAITFAPSFPGGTPSMEGGSVPFAGVSSGGQWSILGNGFSFGNFFAQFAGVTINPGESFDFALGTFQAPTDQPMGSSGIAQFNFGIDFTDTIVGNLLVDCHPVCSVNNLPNPSFMLGDSASSSDLRYFTAEVAGQGPVNVPEPPAWEMVSLAAVAMIAGSAWSRGRRVATRQQT